MATVKKSTQINKSTEKVFDYLSDHKNEPEWMPGMIELNLTSGDGKNVGDTYKWKYKMAGIILRGETSVKEMVPNRKIVTESNVGIKNTFTFNLAPNEEGTLLELHIDYIIPVPVLGKIAEKIVLGKNEREADLALENIKIHLENQ